MDDLASLRHTLSLCMRGLFSCLHVHTGAGEGLGCSYMAMAYVGCTTDTCDIWINVGFANTVYPYFHELGHNMGLRHAAFPSGKYPIDKQYGDLSCSMGCVIGYSPV